MNKAPNVSELMMDFVKADAPTLPRAVSAVIFDWAGTVLDFGCIAPVAAFREAFDRHGLEITEAEARSPMGASKHKHIKLILAQPDVNRRWQERHGVNPQAGDVDRIYASFVQVNAEISSSCSAMIPGVLETVAELRNRGIIIGSTTGYPRSIMDELIPLAEAQGYRPDCCITADDVEHGRPWPDMLLANVLSLGIRDVRGCVVVDDSSSGLVAARAAGMWAIGAAVSGNEVGFCADQWEALDQSVQAQLRETATAALTKAGAHHVIDTVAQLIPAIDLIELELVAGARP